MYSDFDCTHVRLLCIPLLCTLNRFCSRTLATDGAAPVSASVVPGWRRGRFHCQQELRPCPMELRLWPMEGSGASGRGSREPGPGRHKELGLEPTVRDIRLRNKGPGKGRHKDLGQATVTDIRLRQGRHRDKEPGSKGRLKELGLATVRAILLHRPHPPPRLQPRASLRV